MSSHAHKTAACYLLEVRFKIIVEQPQAFLYESRASLPQPYLSTHINIYNIFYYFCVCVCFFFLPFDTDDEDDRRSHQQCGAEGLDGMEIHCLGRHLTQGRQANTS